MEKSEIFSFKVVQKRGHLQVLLGQDIERSHIWGNREPEAGWDSQRIPDNLGNIDFHLEVIAKGADACGRRLFPGEPLSGDAGLGSLTSIALS